MSTAATKVLLAETWTEDVDPTGWWMSEKLDGVRAYWSGSDFYSRQGNLFHVPGFFKVGLPKIPLDGEIWCGRGLFQKCISIVKKQANKVIADDYKLLTYLVFDAPTHGGKYEDRVKWLQTNVAQEDEKCFATVVGIKKCQGLADLKQCLAEVNAAGGEGVMLRKPGSLYENKRSSTLLKVKTFYDEEALVIGHKPGKGNCTGMLGALECELPNGKRFDVGSGFNNAQRRNPPKKGAVITFKFQELSDAGSPRFPVFLRIRSDLTWKDVLEAAKTKKPISTTQKVVPTTKLSKQHSILFSVIPSHDVKPGTTKATSDDEDAEAPSSSTSTTIGGTREVCEYGAKCYRTNADHLKQYQHPSSAPKSKSTKANATCTSGSKRTRPSPVRRVNTRSLTKSQSQNPADITAEDSDVPNTTSALLVNDKNKNRQFADDDEHTSAPAASTKRKRNLQEKPNVKSLRKRVRKS